MKTLLISGFDGRMGQEIVRLAPDYGFLPLAYQAGRVGDALLDALEARAREKNLAFLTLEVREGNAPARALYGKHGFRDVGRRKNYYEKPREDAILMTKELI